jgi:Glycosyltransferase 61
MVEAVGGEDILAGYGGFNPTPAYREIVALDELGLIQEPHRLRLGTDMSSGLPSPLFNEASLPQDVSAEHRRRIMVPGAEFIAVPGYELGSFGLLQQSGRVFVDDKVQPSNFNELIQPDRMPPHWVRGLLKKDVEIIESADPIGIVLNAHMVWGHFLLEMMTRIYLLAMLRSLGHPIKVAMPSDAPGWIREFIGLYFSSAETLSYDSERQRIRAPCFILPSMMMANYHLHPMLNAVVRDLLGRLPGARPTQTVAPQRLYLSRSRHAGWHAIANENEVEATLVDLGFTILHPQEMSVSAQIAAYAACDCIVSQYSSASHNAIFAPLGTPVMCFGWMNRCQSGIAALRGQPLAYVKPSDTDLMYPPHGQGVFKFQVDCHQLAREVPAFLRFSAPN